ncbi:MAG: TonB-dependent receptor [Pseudomonadota bacterium]
MKKRVKARPSRAALGMSTCAVGVLLGILPFQAALSAQADAGADADADEGLQEVVVTGSLIRGIAPTGANVVALDQSSMEEVGAQTVPQLIATIPQLSQFGQVAQAPLQNTALSAGRSTYRPTLRQLPAGTVNPLLVMVDGHALVGAGIQQTDADPGLIPPGAIERLEVVLDGGSSLYGANAIGGVLNFITRSRFEGLELVANAGAGSGNGFRSGDLSITAGRNWDGGNGLVSLYLRDNTNLSNADRPLPRQDLRAYGFPDYRRTICSPGNVTLGTTTYALPNFQPNTRNLCDTGLGQDTASAEQQIGAFASLTQSISESVDLNLKGVLSNRHTKPTGFALNELAASISNANPFFRPVGTETRHLVAFNYSPVAGDIVEYDLWLKGVDLTSTLTWNMAGGWRTVGTLNYGRTQVRTFTPGVNTTASSAALSGPGLTTATALNPYNLTATNPAVLDRILDWRTQAANVQTQTIARVIMDGEAFSLPAGPVKVAIGAQYMNQGTDGYQVTAPNDSFAGGRFGVNRRDVLAAFGQVNIPLVSEANEVRLVHSLNLDLSARYDYYDTVGGTTNPRIGATWEPVEGLRIRGSWSTAYTAPTVVDETPTGSMDASVQILQTGTGGALLLAGDPLSNLSRPSLVVGGALPNTQKPQEAKTWSFGFDLNPTTLPGLDISSTFWRVEMTDTLIVGCPGTTEEEVASPRPGCSLKNPTLAQLQTFLPPGLPVSGLASSIESLYANGTPPYLLVGFLRQNGGAFETQGIDYRIGYRHTLGWGSLYASAAGTKYLQRESQSQPGAPFLDSLINSPAFNSIYTVGADVGANFTANVRANYQRGFPVNNLNGRTHMPKFTTMDLFLRYSFNESLQLTFNANNVLDEMPVVVNTASGQYVNAAINQQSTLGRYFALGVKKTF